jgi:predicted HD phosphohydrolase
MAEKAGLKESAGEPVCRTGKMLNAALRAWEAKQSHNRYRSGAARRSPE